MPSIRFEGRRVPFEEGDSVAAALFRDGVRTFTRSIKHHRRRGLYCLSGDCANCLLNVDGRPGVRSCVTEAAEGMRVHREGGWPSVERDLLSIADRTHLVMPVGFYYKTFVRPRVAWPIAERVIRRTTGVGRLPLDAPAERRTARNASADVVVIGAGLAGLSAAREAARLGRTVLVADERRIGDALLPGPDRSRVETLAAELRSMRGVTVLEQHTAIGVYDGPLVPLVGPQGVVRARAGLVVVATGCVEAHPVFPGNDIPGVFLSRGAARLAAVHHIAPGRRIVTAVETPDGLAQLGALVASGVRPVAILTSLAPSEELRSMADEVVPRARIVRAEGRTVLRGIEIAAGDLRRRIACDALVACFGTVPRDDLLRTGSGLPVVGAGEVIRPGCGPEDAVESGARAVHGTVLESVAATAPVLGRDGYVCPCEDVSLHDLRRAWAEGWRSSEILKRYTTATMGPCQGALCSRHLAAFCASAGGRGEDRVLTTARPPVRPVALEDLAAGVHEVVEKRTSLHERHVAAGGVVDWSGSWKRPYRYGDVVEEYRAVRERASVMDVGTLGKFLVAGRDGAALLDAVFPTPIADLTPGRSRYLLALDEAGYVVDDGLVCALGDGRFVLTSTSGGADRMEARLRERVDRLGMHVHLLNRTATLGAINLAGPQARTVLERLTDDDVGPDALPHLGHVEITVAGVPCHAMRVGFVGEVSFELHHPRSHGPKLWDALLDAGRNTGIKPHGLDALDLLRLEKAHLYLGQDTLPDDHPWKLGLGWAVAMEKGPFVGRTALQRMRERPLERRLVRLAFEARPQRGSPLSVGGRIVGRVTSCGTSPALGRAIGLGWLRAVDGIFPDRVLAGDVGAHVVARPFYDPEGTRLRA